MLGIARCTLLRCLLKVIYFVMSDIALLLEKNINLTNFLAKSLQNIITQNMLGGRKSCRFCMYANV